MVFVDAAARIYPNWAQFCATNECGPDALLVAPPRGIYTPDDSGRVRLVATDKHHRAIQKLDAPATCAGVVATVVTVAAMTPLVAPLIPAVALTGAVVAGVTCSGHALVRGIGRLFDRAAHKQTIGVRDREARGVWLNVVGNSMGLVAGAAMRAVELAARNGVALSRMTTTVVTGLNMATIATNGVGMTNTFYCLFQVRGVRCAVGGGRSAAVLHPVHLP